MSETDDIIQSFERLLRRESGKTVIAWKESRDFYDEPFEEDELEQIYESFRKHFAVAVEVVSDKWGQPAFRGTYESDDFPKWAEGEEVASWNHGTDVAYICWYHMDRELPVTLELGVLSENEADAKARENWSWMENDE